MPNSVMWLMNRTKKLKEFFGIKRLFRYNISFIDPPLWVFDEILNFPEVMIFPEGVYKNTRNTCMQRPLALVSKELYFPNMKYLENVVNF